ncbi:hypothetical protein ACEN2I_19970 [Flavobacterium sp. W22_SRS_FK3]|uniref:hypothetical protein n=1 Tax=Flavobacterium sp. W22_SRS_FK3 TaxID=3240275 RepID=UPI003F93BD17
MRNLFFFVIIFFTCNNIFANAYPITPRPLRKLVIESDAAIVGKVINVTDKIYEGKKKKRVYYPLYKIAKIVVIDILQGEVKNDTIEILFQPNMTCPDSDRYYEKTSVIAFLDINNGKYSTHALSYGSKTLDSVGISVYKRRINEIQKILKITDSISKRTETIEWLVKCAENEVTSWEGVFELRDYKEFSNSSKNYFYQDLNAEQKARLKKAFLNSLKGPFYDFNLSDLIYEENKLEIDNILLERLKHLSEDDYYHADEYIDRLKYKNSSEEMKTLLKRYYEIRFEEKDPLERNKIIVRIISLIDK